MRSLGENNQHTEVNPSGKLVLHVLLMVLISVVRDPLTTFLLMMIPALLTFVYVRMPIKQLITFIVLPFLLLSLLSFWGIFAFAKGEEVYFAWGWFQFTEVGLQNGLTIGFRTLGYLFYGALFILTTDVTSLVLSLMQQLRLKPKWAYSILAGIRFIPILKDDFTQIRAAHKVRGVHRSGKRLAQVRMLAGYTVPLLSQGIRKSERVAIALEARNFDGSWNRTFYRQISWSKLDIKYAAIMLISVLIIVVIATYLGFIRWGLVK
ncbi:HMP/thiamine ABC transporter permease ThiX [Lentibacillus halophilus]|uniref:HMP/thiamine ABC transporter permease ThiX n=1 Tax=Lentibacillus halophilus TaxID=295065 RepID=A0ABN0Z3V0_9BACI